jgi:hypothetical protein
MKIAIPAAAALALATAGCYYGGDAAITFSWSLSRNGTPLTCEAAGAATLDLVASQRGFDRVYHEVIPCDLLGVTFDGFRPGMYDVAINLVDANGNALNEPFALPVAMYGDQLTDLGNLEFAFDSGRFAASWVITINGADATCEDVGATIFQITSRLGGQEYVDTFECGRMAALTEDLPPGSLVVGIALLDEDGATLNAAPFVQEVTLGAGETKNLGEFEFAFNYRKAFFRAHMGTAATLGGNCQSTDPDGGAGVVQQEIRVTRPGSAQCVPTTWAASSTRAARRRPPDLQPLRLPEREPPAAPRQPAVRRLRDPGAGLQGREQRLEERLLRLERHPLHHGDLRHRPRHHHGLARRLGQPRPL